METQNSITQVYDDHVLKVQAAYSAFSTIYEAKNPRPTLGTVKRDIVSLIIVIALVIVSTACIIVSSSRTIPEFGGDLIGAVAFVMIDLGTVVYAFFRARRNANPKRLQNTVKWATAGLILTFLIGVAANVDATLKAHHIEIDSTILAIINLGVAISAPTLGFISSDVLAIELMATDIKRREMQAAYQADCEVWKNDLNHAWNSQQKNWGVTKIEVETPKQISPVSPTVHEFHENFHEKSGEKKRRVKLHEVAAKIREAGDENLSTEDMMSKYEISMGSTTKIRELLNVRE